MMAKMSTLKRSALVGTAIALTALLGACAGGGSGSETQPSQQANQDQTGSKISDPRDATAVDLCKLLPADAATSLGLNPSGEVDDKPKLNPDEPPTCTWKSEDGSTIVSLGPMTGTIEEYRKNKSIFVDYQELTIAGHPAVQGNRSNPAETGNCWMYLGSKDNQLLAAFAMGNSAPCSLTQKALEASVPTLPAAK